MIALLSPPTFDSEERTQRARIFHQVALMMMAIVSIVLTAIVISRPELALRASVSFAVVNVAGAVLLAVNRRGRTRQASVALVVVLVTLVTVQALNAGGVRSPGVGFYLVFVLMASLLLGVRAGIVTAFVCSGLGATLLALELAGALPAQTVVYDAHVLWLLGTLYMGLVVTMAMLSTRVVEGALARARVELAERQKAEAGLELALEAGAIGVWSQKQHRGPFSGSERSLAIFGLPPEWRASVPYEAWKPMVHAEDREQAESDLDRVWRGTAPRMYTAYRIARTDGAERFIEAWGLRLANELGVTTSLVGMVHDVTDRRAAEEERETLLVNVGERVKELRLLHRASRLLQHGRPFDRTILEDLLSVMPQAWMFPEICEARITYLDFDLRTPGWGESPWMQSEAFVTNAGGGSLAVMYRDRPPTGDRPFLDEERALLRSLADMLVAYLDYEATEVRRRALEEQLRHAHKLDALGTLAGGIAHDFNNILTGIGFNLHFANNDLPDGHPARESLREIDRAYERATDLVKRILLFSRKEESRRRVVSLAPVVTETLRLLRASLPPMIEMRSAFDPDVPLVSVDPSQFHQVMMNLGVNAGHAMAQGGVLSVELARVVLRDSATEARVILSPGTYLKLTVGDTGTGMTPEVLQRLFEPFFTTKGVDGTGLGLSVVHGIVKDHGGAIAVESRPGEGTAFRIYLPEAAPADREEVDDARDIPRGAGEHIMYVDDERALVPVVCRILTELGYRCTGFSDPYRALRAFRKTSADFAAVISDGAMPGMTGLQLARELREIRPEMPIGLMSGFVVSDDAVRAAGVGVRLNKPPSVADLGRALQTLLKPGARPD